MLFTTFLSKKILITHNHRHLAVRCHIDNSHNKTNKLKQLNGRKDQEIRQVRPLSGRRGHRRFCGLQAHEQEQWRRES